MNLQCCRGELRNDHGNESVSTEVWVAQMSQFLAKRCHSSRTRRSSHHGDSHLAMRQVCVIFGNDKRVKFRAEVVNEFPVKIAKGICLVGDLVHGIAMPHARSQTGLDSSCSVYGL